MKLKFAVTLFFILALVVTTVILRFSPRKGTPEVTVEQVLTPIEAKPAPQANTIPSITPANRAMANEPPVSGLAAVEENEDDLPEEEKLARVDPVWRKTWERYKKMFIMAQQMRQQPPTKPVMPGTRPPEPEPPPVSDEDEDPNPFHFPEE